MPSKLRGVIVLEGADCSGKTTLARHIVKNYGARYLHGRVFPDMWKYHVAMMRLALKWADRDLVVVDRLWLSELIYGQTYRGGPAYDLGARSLERVLQRAGAVTILCVPGSPEEQLKEHAKRSAAGQELFRSVEKIVAAYADLRHGNLAVPGSGYLAQLTRYGDYALRNDVVVYDLHNDGGDMDRIARRAVKRLAKLRSVQYPPALDSSRANFAGNAGRARFLFVSSVASRFVVQWPWFTWVDTDNVVLRFNQMLLVVGFDETTGCWTDINSADQHLSNLMENYPRLRVVALDRTAHDCAIDEGRGVPEELRYAQFSSNPEHLDALRRILA